MGQQLAAVRLRLDNLFIKQSIIGRPEPYAAETKGAMSVTCGNWGPISEDAEAAEGFTRLRGQLARGRLLAIAAIFRYGK
jgi:hypothetical protein